MTTAGTRRGIAACGAVALAVFVAACSSGGAARVSTDSRAKPPSNDSALTTPSKPSTTPTSTHKRKTPGTAVARSSGTTATTPNATATVTVPVTSPAIVQTGDTTPPTTASTPTTSARPPTTQARPPTTVAGPKPYDPTKPIDLSGTPGVTPAQQARAEKLIRDTLRDTPKYANPQAAYADGYRSIGDSATGDEHYVKWAYVDDGRILDSKYPESLVYEYRNGKQTLVAAMYSLPLGSTFADVPDVGGALTQWHVHNDLCLTDNPHDPLQKLVSSLVGINGKCPAGTTKAGSSPMLHVWIVPNPCGPFAALEGIGAGQVPPGQTRFCDTGHGSG